MDNSEYVDRMDTKAILDMKWSRATPSSSSILALACAQNELRFVTIASDKVRPVILNILKYLMSIVVAAGHTSSIRKRPHLLIIGLVSVVIQTKLGGFSFRW